MWRKFKRRTFSSFPKPATQPEFLARKQVFFVFFDFWLRYELARGCYLEVLRVIPHHARAYFGLAWLSEKIDRNLEKARQNYTMAIQLDNKLKYAFVINPHFVSTKFEIIFFFNHGIVTFSGFFG